MAESLKPGATVTGLLRAKIEADRLLLGKLHGDYAQMVALATRDFRVIVEAISEGVGAGFMSDHEARLRGKLHGAQPIGLGCSGLDRHAY